MDNSRLRRVLLVNTNVERVPYPVPPLGLCMLAESLKGLYDVRIYDGVFDEGCNLLSAVESFNPDFIGFSIRNIDDVVADREIYYIDGILKQFIRPVKSIARVPVILGGSGFSVFPEELMELTGADYGIVGEGEYVFPLLLEYIIAGKSVADLPNVITSSALVVQKGERSLTRTMAGSGFSEIDRKIDFNPYLAKGVYSIQTKRGCSHGCIYCTYPVIEGRKFRTRQASEIADEIEQVNGRLGYITFEFVDSTFNDPRGHAEAICREIISRKLKVRLRTMGMNPRHCSEELFDLMIRAGFVQIDATPDTASPRMLRSLDKGFRLEEIRTMATLIRKFNLPTMWFFLFGGPGENPSTFRETVDFIRACVNPEDLVYMASGLRIYPQTPLYRTALIEGMVSPGESILYPPVYYYSKEMGKEDLDASIQETARLLHNCIPALETSPSPEMIKEAAALRQAENLTEPMFRTLLRIRKRWRDAGLV